MKYSPKVAFTLIVLLLSAISFHCRKGAGLIVAPPASTESGFGIRTPFWSQDGSKIFCLGHLFGIDGDDFYAIDPSGGPARRITHDTLEKDLPVLSPDGKNIAYVAAEMGRIYSRAHVWVMQIGGSDARDLTPSGGHWGNVRWSPDSRYLVFDGGVEDSGVVNYQLARANILTGELKMLTPSGSSGSRDATFFAGGGRIAFSSGRVPTDYGGKVWLMDSDGAHPFPLDTTRTASTNVRPSPVRNEILFVWGLGGESDAGVYRLNLDGTSLPALPSSFHWLYEGDYFNFAQWSPDGELLLFPKGNPNSDLYILNRDGSGLRRVTTGLAVRLFSYAWSPDSRRLVFSASDDGNMTVHTFTYDLDGHALRKIVVARK
mgnify:FL=1